MLAVFLRRVKDYKDGTSRYVYEVQVTMADMSIKTVSKGWVVDHRREQGWKALLINLGRGSIEDMELNVNKVKYSSEVKEGN